ncbi:uncharacterized protein LOC124264887 isoform X1 [Haliotis rubra]|uniref:uncharacterized protein LOC124264887 isoform X1 n=1 Tax=Haliotis rubra TaxID=36100 RepID=UPI001EE633CE|nr:uncharacterized protein LOC124264887 isoform X1 [Haliotis rubra]
MTEAASAKVEDAVTSCDMTSGRIAARFSVDDGDDDIPHIPVLKSETVRSRKGSRGEMETKSKWESLVDVAGSLNQDTRKMFRYMKKKLRAKRRGGETEVKAIHIVPDDDESKWARRSASSAASRTSTDTACSNSSREDSSLQVVHDMAEDVIVGLE